MAVQWRCHTSTKCMLCYCSYACILVVEQTYQAPISFLNCPCALQLWNASRYESLLEVVVSSPAAVDHLAGASRVCSQPSQWPWVINKWVLGQALAHQHESGWWQLLLPMVQLSSGGTPCRCCRMLLLRCPPLPLLLLLPLSSRPQKLPTRDEELFQMQIRDKAFFHDSSVIPDGAEISSYLFRDTPKRYLFLHQVKKLYFENSNFIYWVFRSQYWIQVTKIQMPEFCLEK